MKIKIKHDKHRDKYEITLGGTPLATLSEQMYIDLANAIINHTIKGGFQIINGKAEGRAKGVYYYHLAKGTILGFINDMKKKYASRKTT